MRLCACKRLIPLIICTNCMTTNKQYLVQNRVVAALDLSLDTVNLPHPVREKLFVSPHCRLCNESSCSAQAIACSVCDETCDECLATSGLCHTAMFIQQAATVSVQTVARPGVGLSASTQDPWSTAR